MCARMSFFINNSFFWECPVESSVSECAYQVLVRLPFRRWEFHVMLNDCSQKTIVVVPNGLTTAPTIAVHLHRGSYDVLCRVMPEGAFSLHAAPSSEGASTEVNALRIS